MENENIKINWILDELRSVAIIDDKIIGECEIEEYNGAWAIVHTGVREEFGGRGIAKQLVLKVVEAARKSNKKILPICSYAKKMLEDKDEYKDVLVK